MDLIWLLVLLLIIGWLLGLFVFNVGSLIHVLIVVVIVLIIVRLIMGNRPVL